MGWDVWPPFPGVRCLLLCVFLRTKGCLFPFTRTQNFSVASILWPYHLVLLPPSILKVKLNRVVYAEHKPKFSVENVEERVLNSSASNNQWARHLEMWWILIVEICPCCGEVYLKCFIADESMFAKFKKVSVLACILNIPRDCVFNFFFLLRHRLVKLNLRDSSCVLILSPCVHAHLY